MLLRIIFISLLLHLSTSIENALKNHITIHRIEAEGLLKLDVVKNPL